MSLGIPSLALGMLGGRSLQQRVDALYGAMLSPSLPMPAFVEGWASNTFHGQNRNIPTGYETVPPDSEGQRIFNITVSGAQGDSTLTGVGFDTTQGAGAWGCSIEHDDGSYGLYTASGITATTISISPALRAATTAKNLAAIGGSLNGQHYGLQATQALAARIFGVTNRDGYRGRYAGRWRAEEASGWTLVSNPFVAYNSPTNSFPNTGAGSYFHSRGSPTVYFSSGSASGKGLQKTFSPGGASGYLETFVGLNTGTEPFRVRVLADAVEIYNETLTAFTRIVAPFTSAVSVTVEITSTSDSSNSIVRIGDTTAWVFDRSLDWDARVIDVDKPVVVLGDSWSARYSGGLGLKLQSLVTGAAGSGTVSTVALGGMTAEWGLEQFNSSVAPLLAGGGSLVIEFFTNDRNQYGNENYNRWLKAMYSIGRAAQDIGARPIFVMPLPTLASAQSVGHGFWARQIGAGLPV